MTKFITTACGAVFPARFWLCATLTLVVNQSPVSAASSATALLIPIPAQVETCEGSFPLPDEVTYTVSADKDGHGRLQRAILRLGNAKGLRLAPGDDGTINIQLAETSQEFPMIATDESYKLAANQGKVIIQAKNIYGAIRALNTLEQLVGEDRVIPCVAIEDSPRYPWRGLLIDAARHWMPIDVMQRQVDVMSRYKMNVLHWHLSDDQSFRVESKAHPELNTKGNDGNFYTQEQVREFIEYAADRGVRVVPEFDLPGHSKSWQVAYPQLSSVPGKTYTLYGQKKIFSDPLNPVRAENLALIKSIVTEMIALFADQYFHIGGDEVDTSVWEDNEEIQQFMADNKLATEAELQSWFIGKYVGFVKEAGRTPIGWDEVAGGNYPGDAVIHKWRTKQFSAAEEKHPVIVSTGFYLDHMQTAWTQYRNDPAAFSAETASINILGAEAAVWTESVDADTIDMRAWPRTIAIAELLWSPQATTRSQTEQQLYERLLAQSQQLAAMGLTHETHTKTWFLHLLGPERAQPVITLASVSRPEMFASMMGAPLKTLLSFVGIDAEGGVYDGPLALSPFIDHLAPESLSAWTFNETAQRYVTHPTEQDRLYLETRLTQWKDNHEKLVNVLAVSPEFEGLDLQALSAALKEMSEAGLLALQALAQHEQLSIPEPRRIVEKYSYLDPQMSPEWFRREIFKPSNLFKSSVFVQVKLPVQRGILVLVNAAEGES